MYLLLPMLQMTSGIPPLVWWSHFERITAAIDELDCRAFLG